MLCKSVNFAPAYADKNNRFYLLNHRKNFKNAAKISF